MAPKKRAAAKPKPWVRILNSARENNIQAILSATKHVLYVKTPLGRADLERNSMLTQAGTEYFRLPQGPPDPGMILLACVSMIGVTPLGARFAIFLTSSFFIIGMMSMHGLSSKKSF